MDLPDIQKQSIDSIELDDVGVKDIQLPIRIKHKEGGYSSVKADMKLGVTLDGDKKGTHMSRFIQFIEEQANSNIDMDDIYEWTEILKEQQNAPFASITMSFEYPIRKFSPETNIGGTIYYDVMFKVKSDRKVMSVTIPITTLCPCSKEISEYGAHNQRANVEVIMRTNDKFVWIEDVIDVVEKCASAPLYAVLKREDEKYVTEKAYENPKFVEDVARCVAINIDDKFEFENATIEVTSHESIHQHDAFAKVTI